MLDGVDLICCTVARCSGVQEIVNATCKQRELFHLLQRQIKMEELLFHPLLPLQRMEGTQLCCAQLCYTQPASNSTVA